MHGHSIIHQLLHYRCQRPSDIIRLHKAQSRCHTALRICVYQQNLLSFSHKAYAKMVQFAQTGDGELIFRGPLNDREQKGKMLIATDASRKASLDMRLVDQELFGDDPVNKARMKARSTSCKSNLRSINQMVMMYWDDYKNGLPNKSPSGSTQNCREWSSLLWEHYMGGIKTMRFTDNIRRSFLQPRLRGSVFACPELSLKNPNRKNILSLSYVEHDWTMCKSNDKSPWTNFKWNRPKYTPWNVKNPSKCLFLADYNGSGTFGTTRYFYTWSDTANCRFDGRHPAVTANVLFLGGNVESRKYGIRDLSFDGGATILK